MVFIKHISALLLGALLLFPIAVEFSHCFSSHTHELCVDYADKHFHKNSLDCELHSFHQSPVLAAGFINFEPVLQKQIKKQFFEFYQFLNNYQKLSFQLRGPPVPSAIRFYC